MLLSLEVNEPTLKGYINIIYSITLLNVTLMFCAYFKQKEMDKTKSQRDHEEKLIVSAWYNMVRDEVKFICVPLFSNKAVQRALHHKT